MDDTVSYRNIVMRPFLCCSCPSIFTFSLEKNKRHTNGSYNSGASQEKLRWPLL